jgi:hypothetical protein
MKTIKRIGRAIEAIMGILLVGRWSGLIDAWDDEQLED